MEFDRGTVAMYGGLLMGVLGVVRKETEKETTNCCWVVVGLFVHLVEMFFLVAFFAGRFGWKLNIATLLDCLHLLCCLGVYWLPVWSCLASAP